MLRSLRNPITIFRVLFGVVWLVDAFFKWQPGFRAGFVMMLQGLASGEPGIFHAWLQFWSFAATNTGPLLPTLVAVSETALGLALITGVVRRAVYVLGALYALFVWAVGESFGGPYALGATTDVGAAIIYAFVFAALFLLDPQSVVLPRRARSSVLENSRRPELAFVAAASPTDNVRSAQR